MKLIVSIAVVYLIYSLTLIKSFRTSFFNFILSRLLLLFMRDIQLISVYVRRVVVALMRVFSFVNFSSSDIKGVVTLYKLEKKINVCLPTKTTQLQLIFDFLID